ncbi:MAG: HAMP domain-containing protein [Acidobacteria bacterium]|nr:MAG: HAMP domain-containing protein [Acidobacteriota bacterium]
MDWRRQRLPRVFARSRSMRRRVAYSLGVVRLILVPVILLAIYYLFRMGWIVDRIVSVDAAVAMQAERASLVMLDAQRSERNYFLLHDQQDFKSSQQTIENLRNMIQSLRRAQAQEALTIEKMLADLETYQQGMGKAAERVNEAGQPRIDRLRGAIASYEKDLNDILHGARPPGRAGLLRELHDRTSRFDSEIAVAGTEDPILISISGQLQESANSFLSEAAGLESRSWNRVERDHRDAQRLMRRAEWVLGIVSFLTLLISIWASYVLPKEVVQPLLDLKAAVDHAAAGKYEIEFDVQGKGEVVDLANSVRDLIAHVHEKKSDQDISPS